MAEPDLESIYREAQSALKARDYNRASELLRQILVIDENYKDVSRLLAQAVKLRRRRWYNHPMLRGVLGLMIIVLLGFFIAPCLRGMYAIQLSATITDTVTATPPPTVIATATETLLPAPTSIPLTWKRVSIGQEFERDTVTTIVIDPKDQDVLYAGMKNAGIYKSIDGGLSWRPAHHGLTNAHVVSLLIDSQNARTLYAGTLEGIYKTEDGAENWSKIGTGIYLLMDPQNSSHLYARNEDDIYESIDQGKNWRGVYSTKKGCPGRIRSWAIHPIDSKTLFAVGGEECEPGLYLSSDGGNTWILEEKGGRCTAGLSVGLDRQGKYFIIDTCELEYSYFLPPPTFDVIYSYWDSDGRLYKEGEQRRVLGKPDVGFVRIIAISPDDPDTLYVGGEGMAVSRDGGLTWTKLNNGLGSGILQLDASTGDIPMLYVQTGECDEVYDPGKGWDRKQSLYISADLGGAWDFAGDTGCSLIKDAGGSTFYRLGVKDVPGGESYGWIWRSTDAGRSWEKIFTPERVFTLAADQTQSGVLYASFESAGDGVLVEYFSEDYGHTWKRMDPAISVKPCYGTTLQYIDAYRPMAIDPVDGNHVFVIDNGTLLESHNSCDTMETFATSPNRSMNSIAFDPDNPDTLYAGTDSGAYISFDGGNTWNQINDGLLGATVAYSIAVDKVSNVYAATPYGIFKLEGK